MSETIQIAAAKREAIGKANQRLKGSGQLAAVMYGAGHEPVAISIDRHEFEQLIVHESGLGSQVIHLVVDEGKPVNVMVKEVKRDPVKGLIQHVDFWAIKLTQQVTTTVPIHFVGESAGEKVGGVMTHNLRELSIEALATHIPESVEADVSALEIGDSLHVEALVIPEGVTLHTALDEIVCSVLAPRLEVEEVVEEEEAAEGEPEVIGEKAEESGSEE